MPPPPDRSTESARLLRATPEEPTGGHSPTQGVVEQTLRIVQSRKWVFLQALLLIPLLALALSLLQDERYTATASLLFRSDTPGLIEEQDEVLVDPERAAATNEELVSLPVVASRAASRLGGGVTGEEVENRVEVSSTGEADVIEINATAPSAKEAARTANAYAQAYIAFRRDSDRAQVADAIALVERNLAALPPDRQNGATARGLQRRLSSLRLAQSLQTGKAELVQPAAVPDSPSSPKTVRNVILGLLFGAAFGFGLAALLERLDRRLKTIEEVEEIFGLPLLGRIPRDRLLSELSDSPDQPLGDVVRLGEAAEAFRTLRANLRYFDVDRRIRSILIVSPRPGDGKSTVARGLAMTMAAMGDDVALVDADLHKDGSSAPSPAPEPPGLSLVLAGAVAVEDALTEVPVFYDPITGDSRTLASLPSGPPPPNPSQLLESARMRSVVRELEERFEVIVIDTPPLSGVSDALSLVGGVSGALIVAALGESNQNGARDLKKQLSLLRARQLGVVANFWTPDRRGYYYGYDRTAAPAGL